MKEDFEQEHELRQQLDLYKIDIPHEQLSKKRTRMERVLHFLTSPAKNPLEEIENTSRGYFALKTVPIACGVILAVVQTLLFI